ERLRAAQILVRGRRAEIVARVTGLRQGMPDPDVVMRQLAESEARLSAAIGVAAAAAAERERAIAAVERVAPRWEAMQRERDELQAVLSELRVAEGEETALRRDTERLERDLAEIAAARAEREALRADLEPYGRYHAEFQHLESLAREEGRRRALLATRQRLEEEISLAQREKREELELVDGQLEARGTEWVRDRQEAETKRQALRDPSS